MKITDPGSQYHYLNIEIDGRTLQVFKDCRVRLFSAFWITEPVPEDQKPDTVMPASKVPSELWNILTTEERLWSLLAESKQDVARLEKQKVNFIAAIIVLATICYLAVSMILSR